MLTYKLTRDFEVNFRSVKALEKRDAGASGAESNAERAGIRPKLPFQFVCQHALVLATIDVLVIGAGSAGWRRTITKVCGSVRHSAEIIHFLVSVAIQTKIIVKTVSRRHFSLIAKKILDKVHFVS